MLGGLLSGLGAASIWGAMFVVSKVVLAVIPPFSLLTLRLVLGTAALGVLWVWVRQRASVPPAGRSQLLSVLAAGFVGYGVSLGLQFVGTDLTTASNAALVTCATPAFVVLFAAPLLKERIQPRQWAALGIATLGVIAVLSPSLIEVRWQDFEGNLILVGAAITWALYTVLTARAARGMDLTLASVVGFLGGLPLSLGGSLWELGHRPLGLIDGSTVAGVLFLGLVSTALAMLLWNHAFRVLPASTAGLTFFAQPVVGTLLGFLILGEIPGPLFYLGGGFIVLALVLTLKRDAPERPP